MAVKVLGQAAPVATTNTTVYTVAAGKSAVLSTIVVCNQGSAGTFSIYVKPGGGSPTQQNYIFFNAPIDAGATASITVGVTMTATDILGVNVSNANMSVSVFGDES